MAALRPLLVKALQKMRLNKAAHRLYYSYLHGFHTSNTAVLAALTEAFERTRAKHPTGRDYYEFGVFKGYSFWHAQRQAADLGLTDMRYFGFDSFAGLPEIEGPDLTQDEVFYAGQYACTKEEVTANLDAHGVDWKRTFLIEGYFDRSLTPDLYERYRMRPIAVALIDCDLYASTAQVLDFIHPLIAEDSILLFDDWNCFDGDDEKGQRLALRQFCERYPDVQIKEGARYGHWGKVFMASPGRASIRMPAAARR